MSKVTVNAQKQWDAEKKEELVKLGQSNKPYNQIIPFLEQEIANSKRMTDFIYKISCFKDDGIYQLYRAIEEIVGVSSVKDEKKPSSDANNPIKTIDICLANGTRKKIPYGQISLPDMGEEANIDIAYSSDEKVLYVKGLCQFRFQHLIDSIIDRTKELLNTDSIYKDQALEINAEVNNGQPVILNLSQIDNEVMILSEETEYALSPLYARILHPEKCRQNNIPIKFGALLEGTYG